MGTIKKGDVRVRRAEDGWWRLWHGGLREYVGIDTRQAGAVLIGETDDGARSAWRTRAEAVEALGRVND